MTATKAPKKAPKMDIRSRVSKTLANQGVFMPVKNAEEEETDFRIKLLGTDSDVFKACERASRRRRLLRLQTKQKLPAADRVVTEEELAADDAEALDTLCKCTIGWENGELDGEVFIYSPEHCQWLYENSSDIREQVDTFIGERAHFLSSSSTPASASLAIEATGIDRSPTVLEEQPQP